MTPREVYDQLQAHGARVEARGDGLEIDAPEGVPGDLLEWAKTFKPDLIALVKEKPIKQTVPTINAAELMRREFQEPKFAVQGIIPEGLTLFAGKPKLGKSWFVLGVAVAVASGGRAFGKIPVEQGTVLYLALEDSHRRLQSRLEQVLGDASAPPELEFKTELARLDDGGIFEIRDWIEAHPKARLVIIDTLARVKPRASKNAQLYDADSDAVKPLHRLALERGLAILIVHHTRKAGADDVFDTISSSTGLTGIVDAMIVLQRARGEATAKLDVTGRDIDEQNLAMSFDPVSACWTIQGDAKQFENVTPERRAVLDALERAGNPLKPADIAKGLNRDSGNTRKLLLGMKRVGLVHRNSDGAYSPTSSSENVTPLPSVTSAQVTPFTSSDTSGLGERYSVTAHEQNHLIEHDTSTTETPVTKSKTNAEHNLESVTVEKQISRLTPALEVKFRKLKPDLGQADRMTLPNLIESARKNNTDALKQLFELEKKAQDNRMRAKS
jgi:AAA domain/Winged helix-turn-helix transcription repressor, HrcA DNA-binding